MLVSKEGGGITFFAHFVTVVALHMDGRPAQVALADHLSHPPGGVAKLIIMSGGYFQLILRRQPDQFLCLGGIKRERFFQVNVATLFQALFANLIVALWR